MCPPPRESAWAGRTRSWTVLVVGPLGLGGGARLGGIDRRQRLEALLGELGQLPLQIPLAVHRAFGLVEPRLGQDHELLARQVLVTDGDARVVEAALQLLHQLRRDGRRYAQGAQAR